MQRLRLPFIQASPDIDERPADGETPEQYVERLAIEKTKALASQYPQHWIKGSDPVSYTHLTLPTILLV